MIVLQNLKMLYWECWSMVEYLCKTLGSSLNPTVVGERRGAREEGAGEKRMNVHRSKPGRGRSDHVCL